MKRYPLLVLAGDDGWRVFSCGETHPARDEGAVTGSPPATTPAAVLDAVQQALDGCDTVAKPVVILALSAHRCYAAQVSTEGLPPRQLRQSLAYRFEPLVPFPVEDLVVDACGHGESRLVVASSHGAVRPVVRVLEENGVLVAAIAPLALLAAQAYRQAPDQPPAPASVAPSPGTHSLRLAEQDARHDADAMAAVSTLTWHQGNLTAWRWCPQTDQPVTGQAPPALPHEQTFRWACRAARDIAAEREVPLINLRRGPLASRQKLRQVRRPLLACGVAAGLLLLATAFALQTRAWQYRVATQRLDHDTRSRYTEAFPGEQVPVSMERRLDTRLRQIEGRQGLATTQTPLFAGRHTLAVIHDLLERLPTDQRMVLTDVRISADRIDLLGHARSHSEADAIAAALRADNVFEVSPPSTENLPERGVLFTLTLTHTPAEAGTASDNGPGTHPLATDNRNGPVSLNHGEAP